MNAVLRTRLLKFYCVGGVGIGVQLAVLWALTRGAGLHYRLATPLAVETAVLHNFAWHELWTWRERTREQGFWGRLLRWHLGNGLVSILGNQALMELFAGWMRLPLLAANVAAIGVVAILNFLLGEFFVFRRRAAG